MDISHAIKDENLIEIPSNLLFDSADGTLFLSSYQNAANVNGQNNNAHSQTMVELGKQLLQAASQGDTETMKILMTSGAPFTGNWLGLTPLHAATRGGHMEAVQQLLKAGIFRDVKTKVDRTALQMAAEEGQTEIAELLLSYGADINAKDMLKMTALHWAVEREHLETVALLVSKGADTKISNKFDRTPLDIAWERNNLAIIDLLQNADLQRQSREANVEKEKAAQKLVEEMSQGIKSTNSSKCYAEYALDELTAHSSTEGSAEGAKLLESHGITLLPPDNSTVLNSAMESGQTLSLTEAGKLALKEIKTVNKSVPGVAKIVSSTTAPATKIKLAPGTTPRVVRMTTSQLLALAGKTLHLPGNNKPIVITLPKNIKFATAAKPGTAAPASSNPTVTPTVPKVTPVPVPKIVQVPKVTPVPVPKVIQVPKATPVPLPKIIQVPKVTPVSSTTSRPPAAAPVTPIVVSTTSLAQTKTPTVGQTVKVAVDASPNSKQTLSATRSPPDVVIETRTSSLANKMTRPAILGGKRKISETSDSPLITKPESNARQGSARTLPITEYCKNKRLAAVKNAELETICSAGNDIFDEDSPSSGVMLSIMEENMDFTNSSAGDDDDILDPLRLAAQLAAIRQAASHFTIPNS